MRLNRWQRWKKTVLIVAALLVLLFGVVGGLWASNLLGWRAWRLQEVEAFIGATLPDGASDVHFATQNTKTRIIWLRFDAPADNDLSAFVTQMGITMTLKTGFTPFPAANPQEAALSWWTPQAASAYAGLYDNTGQKIIEVLLDTDHHTVYVRAYNIAN